MSETLNNFGRQVAQMLGVAAVDMDTPMSQLGVDSLNIVEMVVICQQIYTGVTNYQDIQIDESTTLREIDAQLTALSII